MFERFRGWLDTCAVVSVAICALTLSGVVAGAEELPAIDEITKGLERVDGLFIFYKDVENGRVLIELPPPAEPDGKIASYIYYDGLLTGLGSNPIGLDRGQLGETRILEFRLVGGKLLLEEPNLRYRARTTDALEERAVEQSFATSIHWAGEVEARQQDGTILVDFTSFVVRDAHESAQFLESADQGLFSLDETRSALDPENCLGFPDNVELQAILTFSGDEPGPHVEQTAPWPSSFTLVQHHSFVRLPDKWYRPRKFDPRAGTFSIRYLDYASPLSEEIEHRWVIRHRLEKTNPAAARSQVKEPIVYYVDPGVPEPIRSALLEGAGWWARAFEEAGFIDAFRVELLPGDAHPLDVRYNVIQWVHRSTRGWSYGGGVVDPRTGEMLKGHVLLGSLRVRQDRLLFEGLVGVQNTGTGKPDDPVQLALARIRQLSAHEVGHTLGMAHNFAASTYSGRASVMDYPAPLVGVRSDDSFDFSNVYGIGIGEWDIQAIRYAYSEFPPGASEERELEKIIQEGIDKHYLFISDSDARTPGASHPLANLWDNGSDPLEELEHVSRVRALALDRFGEGNIPIGTPVATLQEVFAPIYFYHRYQIQAVAKMIGGMEYTYAMRGDGQPLARIVPSAEQRRALTMLLDTLSPGALQVPKDVLPMLVPRPHGFDRNRELFVSSTAPAFDEMGAAASVCGLVVGELLQSVRCARLVEFQSRNQNQLGLEELLETLEQRAFVSSGGMNPEEAELQRVVQQVVVRKMIELSADPQTPATVRSRVDWRLGEMKASLGAYQGSSLADRSNRSLLAAEIGRHLSRPRPETEPHDGAPDPPPGSPIGAAVPLGFEDCSWGNDGGR